MPTRTQLPNAPITLFSLVPTAFLPAVIYEVGNGAAAPVIPLTALELGATPAQAGLTLAFLGVGQVLGDVPASLLAQRVGDRRAMLAAAVLAIAAQFCCLVANRVLLFGLGLMLVGAANATFYLARQAYMADVVPIEIRARAMSSLGGAHRLGLFIGPFIGAGLISLFDSRVVYVIAMVAAFAAAILLVVIHDVPRQLEPASDATVPPASGSTLGSNRRLFATLGTAVLAVAAVRAARPVVLPLWAAHIGLTAAETSLVFALAGAVDMSLFYPAGQIMDRFGRLSIALPSLVILGGAIMVLPLTHDEILLTVVAIVMSIGNGIGAGIMFTLGADVAPVAGRLRFFSVWRIMTDFGNAAGPLVIAAIGALWTLGVGIVVIGSSGLLAAFGLWRWVPQYSPLATRASMRIYRAQSTPTER